MGCMLGLSGHKRASVSLVRLTHAGPTQESAPWLPGQRAHQLGIVQHERKVALELGEQVGAQLRVQVAQHLRLLCPQHTNLVRDQHLPNPTNFNKVLKE